MKLYNVFNIDLNQKELIGFVGGGGKTTTIFKLAQELKNQKKRVLVTTTTAIYYPKKEECDKILLVKEGINEGILKSQKGVVYVLGREVSKENKLLGLDKDYISEIFQNSFFDCILVEADGSKRKPIKAPDLHEPVLPLLSTKVVGVIGLDAVNQEINEEYVHRIERFCQLTNSKSSDKITTAKVIDLIIHQKGLFKSSPINCERYLLLNKCTDQYRLNVGIEIVTSLLKRDVKIKGLIISDIKDKKNPIKWRVYS